MMEEVSETEEVNEQAEGDFSEHEGEVEVSDAEIPEEKLGSASQVLSLMPEQSKSKSVH
jgi:hypothetical protein